MNDQIENDCTGQEPHQVNNDELIKKQFVKSKSVNDTDSINDQQNRGDDDDNNDGRSHGNHDENKNNPNFLKKASVAMAGGALIAAGIPLIPLPGPGDFMVVGGLALLATEFPQAQRVIDVSTGKLEEFVNCDDHETEEVEEDEEEVVFDTNGTKEQQKHIGHNNNDELSNPRDVQINIDQPCEQKNGTEKTMKRQSFPQPMEEVDEALDKGIEEFGKAMKQAKKSLRKMTKHTILPFMQHISSSKSEVGQED